MAPIVERLVLNLLTAKYGPKMQCLGILFEVSIKVIRETFSKFFVLKRSTKEAMRSSFGRAPYVLNLLLAKNRQMTCLGI